MGLIRAEIELIRGNDIALVEEGFLEMQEKFGAEFDFLVEERLLY